METFFNTAYRYLKGESDLPSLLPSRESAATAKERSRKLRLFCKGLECFCEILYTEPVAEEQQVDPNVEHNDTGKVSEVAHDEVSMGQDQTMMTAEKDHSKSAVQQNDATPSVIDTVSEQHGDDKVEHNDEMEMAGEEHVEAIMEQDQTMMTAEEGHYKSADQQNCASPSVVDTVSEQHGDDNVKHNDKMKVAGEEHVEAIMEQDQTMMTAEEGHYKSADQQNCASPSVVDTVSEQHGDDNVKHNDKMKVAGEEHVEAIVEHYQKMMTAEGHSELAVQQENATPNVIDAVLEKSISDELTTSADRMRDQEHSGAETTVLGTKADQKPRKYVLESGENLFQSLYATDNTPPTSPGSASSSSTLVDPSSRKVSPSDSTMDTKSSRIAAKDFAYSSLDDKHVRDPLAIAEENTKLELLRQLKKKTVGEEKASQKAEKRKARNLALSTELDATKENCGVRKSKPMLQGCMRTP